MDRVNVSGLSETGPDQLLEILLTSLARILERGGFDYREVAEKLLEIGAKTTSALSDHTVQLTCPP